MRFPWLHPHVQETITRQRAEWAARTPLRWSGAIDWWWRSRARTLLTATFDALAAGAGTQVVQPFLEPAVLGAAAGHFGAAGPRSRADALGGLFGDVLDEPVITRRSKAFFDDAFFSTHSRAFAAGWTGDGVDTALVETERLQEAWRGSRPDPRSFLLLQAAWLGAATLPGQKEASWKSPASQQTARTRSPRRPPTSRRR